MISPEEALLINFVACVVCMLVGGFLGYRAGVRREHDAQAELLVKVIQALVRIHGVERCAEFFLPNPLARSIFERIRGREEQG